jgi:putative flippase GtrA
MRTLLTKQFLLFVLSGGTSVVANLAAREVLSMWYAFPVAVGGAYVVGMLVAFGLMRCFVFTEADGSLLGQGLRFSLVNAIGFFQTVVLSVVFNDHLLPLFGLTWRPELVAHGLALGALVLTSFVLHRKVTFKSNQS